VRSAPGYIEDICDVVVNALAEHRYDFLKAEVIKQLSSPQKFKTRQFLEHEEIGDRKSSQFLCRLRNLAGSIASDELLRSVWLSRLLASIQLQLVARTGDQLAHAADIITNMTRATSLWVAETAQFSRIPDTPVEQNRDRITALEEKMRSLKAVGGPNRDNSNAHRYTRSRHRLQPRPRNHGPAAGGLCWYRQRFESAAKRCEPPCSSQ